MRNKKVFESLAFVLILFVILGTSAVRSKDETITVTKTEKERFQSISGLPVSGVNEAFNIALDRAEKLSINQKEEARSKDSYWDTDIIEEQTLVEDQPIIEYMDVDRLETEYVNAELLNLRMEPSTESEVITVLSYGAELDVIGQKDVYVDGDYIESWCTINYNGTIGYVSSTYLVDYSPLVSLGMYDITYYCPCEICCGIRTGITASGTIAVAGTTIAADPSIPFGTEIIIDGHTYTVQDRGGAIKGNHIDIFCNTHEEALSHQRGYKEVFIKR